MLLVGLARQHFSRLAVEPPEPERRVEMVVTSRDRDFRADRPLECVMIPDHHRPIRLFVHLFA